MVGNGPISSGTCIHSDALVLDTKGNLTISGSLKQNADRRLKTSVEPLDDGVLKKLARLRPVRFTFKNQKTHPAGEQIGLVAQDVQREFPSLVSKGSSGYLSLAYPKLTAVLLKGLREQQAQLRDKQAQIDSLKRRVRSIEQVENRLAALEAQIRPATAGWTGGLPLRSVGLLAIGILLGAGLVHLYRR